MQHVFIYMNDGEWDTPSTPIVDHAIRYAQYLTPAERDELIVDVIEHAGWYVTFGFINGQPVSLGSASCVARTPMANRWRAIHSGATCDEQRAVRS